MFVADRSNNRIQIFDQEGNFLAQWTQFGRAERHLLRRQRPDFRGRFRIRRRAEPGLGDGDQDR